MKKENVYWQVKKSIDLSKFPAINGYDFEDKFDFDRFIASFSTTGIQATELGKAITLANAMIREKVPLFLSFTSNMISSGIRDSIRFLVKNSFVKVLCTSAGGIEEDITQAFMLHRVGTFDAKGEHLLDAGLGRIGNIYTSNEHYTKLEFFLRKVFEELQKRKGKDNNRSNSAVSPSEICALMGEMISKEKEAEFESCYLYWAYKNNIPVYCPAIVDGSFGDILYFYNKSLGRDPIIIDIAKDHQRIIDYVLSCEKTAAIVLGGGVAKHYVLNANIFKEGLDYAIYISTADFYDASDSGGNQEEAVSWAKIRTDAPRVKVHCDASIAFPLLMAGSFARHFRERKTRPGKP